MRRDSDLAHVQLFAGETIIEMSADCVLSAREMGNSDAGVKDAVG
jgi:hypothetical protein